MKEAARWSLQSHLELAALPGAVPRARLHARQILWEWKLDELTETVELAVSEIVTNAVKASGGLDKQQRRMEIGGVPTVRLWLAANEHAVLIQVWDGNDWQPQRRDPGLEAEDGRGLLLVEALTTKWGSSVRDGQPAKVIWAVIETAHLRCSPANARRLLESLDQAQRRPRPTAGVGAGP